MNNLYYVGLYNGNDYYHSSCSPDYILERKKFGRYEFYVTSRNVRQIDEKQLNYHNTQSESQSNVYWDMAYKYDIKNMLKDLNYLLKAIWILLFLQPKHKTKQVFFTMQL